MPFMAAGECDAERAGELVGDGCIGDVEVTRIAVPDLKS